MIEFKKVRFKNFLSYGNAFTEIDFTKSRTTLLTGKNGEGKSGCILDSLVFGLFGTAYRNINKPNLVNSINGKDCLVEVEFNIGKKSYTVRRGIKPTVFEIIEDGKLIDQDSRSKDYQKYLEENILKLNYKSFSQLVVLGSSNYIPFMQLVAADRREVIEELLDIRVFSRMNQVAKEKLSLIKEQTKDYYRQIVTIKEKINLQKSHIDKIKQKNAEIVQTNNKYIEDSNAKIQSLQQSIKLLNDEILELQDKIKSRNNLEEKLKEFEMLGNKVSSNLNQVKKAITFYENNSSCPTCTQNIDSSFKDKLLKEKSDKAQEYTKGISDIADRISKTKNKLDEMNKILSVVSQKQSEITHYNSQILGLNQYVSKIQSENVSLQNEINSESDGTKLLEQFESSLNDVQILVNSNEEMKEYYDIALDLLKDNGIKTKIISQYIPIMNKYINRYLLSMDAYLNFNIDENFKEVIKSRHMDVFEYNSFSEGEKFRIDMAILLMFRDIARQKNSVNTNILILDEVFDSSLDNIGTEQFLKLLKELSKKINIFVISHKADMTDKFDRCIKVEKKNGFSVLSE